MQVLITGASGFAGWHLMRHLRQHQPGAHLTGTVFSTPPPSHETTERYVRVDLCDTEAVRQLIDKLRPDVIYNLAGQASAKRSFDHPWQTLETNLHIQFNLLHACVEIGIQPRMLVVSSAEVYGPTPDDTQPLTETQPLRPTSPYSVSKAAQDLMGLQYHLAYGLPVLRVRPFNHIGPRQSTNFVAPDFALQIAQIEAGQRDPVLQVGNLAAQRDFTDVRDVVRAYHLVIEHGTPGSVYNIASNRAYSIQSLLDRLLALTPVPIEVQVDPAKLRPIDVPVIQGSYRQLHEATGWQPSISLEQTLRDLLDDCRQRVQASI